MSPRRHVSEPTSAHLRNEARARLERLAAELDVPLAARESKAMTRDALRRLMRLHAELHTLRRNQEGA